MNANPKVREYMTTACHSVSREDPITLAKELMQLHAIRHLPVLEAGRLVGMLSLGDLYAMEAVMEVDPDRTDVGQAMCADVYTVGPNTPLAEVAQHMCDEHIGSVVVLEGEALVGLFTASDACRVLAELLGGR